MGRQSDESPNIWKIIEFNNGIAEFFNENYPEDYRIIKCPWRVGNTLWVKETWRPGVIGEHPYNKVFRYKADGMNLPLPIEDREWFEKLTADGKYNWQSSMFMRRKFARIFLKITDIKLERLQDITEEGAIAEGIERINTHGNNYAWKGYGKEYAHFNPVNSYKSLWELINGSGSWELNPWVWVIKFEKIKGYGN